MLLDVTDVFVKPKFTLILKFENGEQHHFHMTAYMEQKTWSSAKVW